MSCAVTIDGVLFDFHAPVTLVRYDETEFYQRSFQGVRRGTKAVDLVVVDGDNEAYLIEVKDYRHPRTPFPKALDEVFLTKVLDTMSGIVSMAYAGGGESSAQSACRAVLGANSLTVVLQCQIPVEGVWLEWLDKIADKVRRRFTKLDVKVRVESNVTTSDDLPWVAA
ncbi:hypothetical protein I6E29_07135 [Arcanobacterium haemolyticum]|nr:hypothetical protein [Arcanobacterium haemolyticum]